MIKIEVHSKQDIREVVSLVGEKYDVVMILNQHHHMIAFYSRLEGFVSSSYYITDRAMKNANYVRARNKTETRKFFRS